MAQVWIPTSNMIIHSISRGVSHEELCYVTGIQIIIALVITDYKAHTYMQYYPAAETVDIPGTQSSGKPQLN